MMMSRHDDGGKKTLNTQKYSMIIWMPVGSKFTIL